MFGKSCFKMFLQLCNPTNLINKATCCKNPNNPFCIDLVLTNSPKYFQNSSAAETRLSQGRSQNLKSAPHNFMEVLKVDDVTANDVKKTEKTQKKQHLLRKENLQISHNNHYCLISIFSIKLLKRLEIWFSFLRE